MTQKSQPKESSVATLKAELAALRRSQAVISFSPDGIIVDANANFLQAVGYARDEVVGKHHRMFMPDGEADTPEYKAFWQSLAEGTFAAREFRRVTKSGADVWIQASYNPLLDKDGKVFLVVKYATDITAQVEKSVDHEGQIAAICRSQAVIAFSPDGIIVDANDNFLAATGYALDEVVGQHHRMFMDPIAAASAEYEAFWADLARGDFKSGEFQRFGKGGAEVWIHASYNPIFDREGRVVKVVKYASDITEQVRKVADQEGQINAIGRSQAVISFAPDGTIQHANDNFLATTGYRLEEVVGRHHRMFMDPNDAASQEYRAFWESLAKGDFKSGNFGASDEAERRSGFRPRTTPSSIATAVCSKL